MGERRIKEVRLHAGGDDRPVPFEQRRNGEPDGLSATGRADDGEAGLRLRCEELPAVKPEREAARRWVAHRQGVDVAALGKPSFPCPERAVASPMARPPTDADEGDRSQSSDDHGGGQPVERRPGQLVSGGCGPRSCWFGDVVRQRSKR